MTASQCSVSLAPCRLSALEDLISQIQNLDMDDVRKKIAEADQAE